MSSLSERAAIKFFGLEGVSERRDKGQEISEAHSGSHLSNVAEITQIIGDLYGFTPKEKLLSYSAGWFHDLDRASTEDPSVGDERASANKARQILSDMDLVYDVLVTMPEEEDAVAYAIENHSKYPSWLDNPEKREKTPEDVNDKLHLALFVADKMEANGVRVIARRSSFVAGDRLQNEQGDLQQFGFRPGRDEALVVALESAIRLSIINPEDIYPNRLKPLVEPLYGTQREFVLGVLKSLGLTTEDVAKILVETKNQEGKSIVEVRKLKALNDAEALQSIIENRGKITDEKIAVTPDDIAFSALETVDFFSSRYRENLDHLMLTWQPAGEAARRWQNEMASYADGTWIRQKQEEARLRRLVQENTKHDEAFMPITMGPAVRMPYYAHDAWGVETPDERTVVDLYGAEWAGGTKEQLGYVSKAAVEAGFGDYPKLLCQEAAKVAAKLLENYPLGETLRIFDIGSGPGQSAKAVIDALPEHVRSKVELILLDPSEKALQSAQELLKTSGAISVQAIHGTDLDIEENVDKESVDILTGVASIHHHAEIPFDLYHSIMKPGGYAIFADWHNSIWEHPYRVREFLEQFDWDKKQEGLKHFEAVYPNAAIPIPDPENPQDRQANEGITRFWRGWHQITTQEDVGRNAIWFAEGHRPVERYVEGMQQAGFTTDSADIQNLINSGVIQKNPHQLLPDSTLLMVTIGQKPA